MTDHGRHHDDVGAYLLGALNELERQAFERHLRDCDECREEIERLRPAAEALPGSVDQMAPPPGLKKRLMAEVEPSRRRDRRHAADRPRGRVRRRPARRR
jgi:anti-sigma factor RsiW